MINVKKKITPYLRVIFNYLFVPASLVPASLVPASLVPASLVPALLVPVPASLACSSIAQPYAFSLTAILARITVAHIDLTFNAAVHVYIFFFMFFF